LNEVSAPDRTAQSRVKSDILLYQMSENVEHPSLLGMSVVDVLNLASDWFWVMDADLRYTYFSRRVEEVTGDPSEYHYGKTRQELGIRVAEGDDLISRHEAFRNVLISRRRVDGTLIWIRSSGQPIRDKDGVFRGYIGTGLDVTAEIDARQEAANRHEIFVKAMSSMSDGIALFDATGTLIFYNRMFTELNPDLAQEIELGMTFREMVESNIRSGRILEAVGREEEFLERRVREFFTADSTERISQRRDGRTLILKEVKLEDGSILLVNTDRSEVISRESELIRLKEEAEKISKAKSDFLANMSHELRTPLNAILGFSEIVGSVDLRQEKIREYARDIHGSAGHLLLLINDLLDLNTIETGRRTLSPEAIDIDELVTEVISIGRANAQDSTVEIDVEHLQPIETCFADRRALKQCLINLISNAVKFSPEDGRVTVMIDADEKTVDLAVLDRGPGMSDEEIANVGEPFSRSIVRDKKQGAGLGLAITKSLIEQMGGELMFERNDGGGIRVTLRGIPRNH
jgi:PAS domain S-box-containing protein